MQELTLDYGILADNIRKLREKHNISQQQLSEYANCSTVHISRIENRRAKPRMLPLITMVNHFNLTLSELFCKDITRHIIYTPYEEWFGDLSSIDTLIVVKSLSYFQYLLDNYYPVSNICNMYVAEDTNYYNTTSVFKQKPLHSNTYSPNTITSSAQKEFLPIIEYASYNAKNKSLLIGSELSHDIFTNYSTLHRDISLEKTFELSRVNKCSLDFLFEDHINNKSFICRDYISRFFSSCDIKLLPIYKKYCECQFKILSQLKH